MLSHDKWSLLADGLPPSLRTNAPETSLKPNETPACTGLSATSEGFIAQGTIPTATTRIVKTYTVAGTTYTWLYNRLWVISGNSLVVGAPDYTTSYFRQKQGEIQFPDDGNAILAFHPIGQTSMIAFKTTGAYIIPNANDRDGRFFNTGTTEFIQEAKIATAGHSIDIDGICYFANTSGVYSIDYAGNVIELSMPIRGDITPAALTADYRNKFVIVGSSHVYDVNMKRWLQYSGSTFLYTSPRIQQADGSPLSVDRVGFEIKWASGTSTDTLGSVVFQTQVEDREWSESYDLQVPYSRETGLFVDQDIGTDTGRDFKMRVNSMSTELSIKRILVRSDKMSPESRAS